MASTLTTPVPARVTLTSSQQTLLKWLALLLMLLDHANRTLWTFQPWAFALGRVAFPLFAFLIAYNVVIRGVSPTRYVLPLLVFGVISQAPAMLALDREMLPLNIFFTLLLSISFLPLRGWLARHLPSGAAWQLLSWLGAIYLLLVLSVTVEYGPPGVLLIPAFMLLLKRPTWYTLLPTVLLLLLVNGTHPAGIAAVLALPVIYAVSTLRVPKLPRLKWFAYSFYPIHLSVLWLLKSVFQGS